MLDVHAPHDRMEGFKDFFLHLFTITVGLLIALGLENLAERVHKNEVRHEAESDLRREVEDNGKTLAAWHVVMQQEESSLRASLDFLKAKEQGQTRDTSKIDLGFTIRSLSDASWTTASATGALSLMDYEQVQQYAGLYRVQDQVMELNRQTLEGFMMMQSHIIAGFDPDKLTPAQASAFEPEVRTTLAHLLAMDQIGGSLAQRYKDLLAAKP